MEEVEGEGDASSPRGGHTSDASGQPLLWTAWPHRDASGPTHRHGPLTALQCAAVAEPVPRLIMVGSVLFYRRFGGGAWEGSRAG